MIKGPIVIDTPDGIAFFRLLQLRGALRIEINTGMRNSRGSVLAAVNQQFGTSFKRKQAALDYLNELIETIQKKQTDAGH